MFQLVSCSFAFQYLSCFVHGQGQGKNNKRIDEFRNLINCVLIYDGK